MTPLIDALFLTSNHLASSYPGPSSLHWGKEEWGHVTIDRDWGLALAFSLLVTLSEVTTIDLPHICLYTMTSWIVSAGSMQEVLIATKILALFLGCWPGNEASRTHTYLMITALQDPRIQMQPSCNHTSTWHLVVELQNKIKWNCHHQNPWPNSNHESIHSALTWLKDWY